MRVVVEVADVRVASMIFNDCPCLDSGCSSRPSTAAERRGISRKSVTSLETRPQSLAATVIRVSRHQLLNLVQMG